MFYKYRVDSQNRHRKVIFFCFCMFIFLFVFQQDKIGEKMLS